ncbi:MAG: Cobalt-zinc-cadmium resistance protein, partial [uncultured Rubrobacteraceae bacterium]
DGGRPVHPVLRGGIHRGGGGYHRAQVRGLPADGVGGVILGRGRVRGQPGGGGDGAVGADARGQAAGRGARLRAQQGRVLLQRARERAHPYSGGLDRRDRRTEVVRARAVAERRHRARGDARRGGDQRRGGPRHPARRAPPALHNLRGRRQAPDDGRLDLGGCGAWHRARRGHGLAGPGSPDRLARRRQHRLDRGAAPARHRPGAAGPGAAGGGFGQDPEGPLPPRGEGHPLPRPPHPGGGSAPLYLHARARAGGVDGQAGPRPRGGDRGRHSARAPPEHLLHPRGTLGGPSLFRGSSPRPRAVRGGQV